MHVLAEPKQALAADAAVAWINAAIAMGQDDSRPALYRTLSVEFFRTGIQFVGCDGAMLFRTWVPYSDADDIEPPHWHDRPEEAVVVSDADKFALGFMKTLVSAVGDLPLPMSFTVEPAEEEEQEALGEDLQPFVLTLQALGQRLSCKLYEGAFPDWRILQLGMDDAERVDGMTLATRLFAAVGKIKGVIGIDCTFRGEDRAIEFSGAIASSAHITGLLMPMKRPESAKGRPASDDQLEHDTDG